MVIYIIYIVSIIGFCLSMRHVYLSANNPGIYLFVTCIPLALTIVFLALRKKFRKWHIVSSVVIIFLIFGTYVYDSTRLNNLNQSYYYNNSAFDDAALKFLPVLSEYDDAIRLEHYHGRNILDEWIAVEVTLHDEQYHAAVRNIFQSYIFYDHGEVSDRAFTTTSTPFLHNGFKFQILNLGETFSRYVGVIGINSNKHSLIYVFAESATARMMSLDDTVGFLLEESKIG